MGRIILIGTSHIARESIERVKSTIEDVRPAFVAVELDSRRYYALTHKVKESASAFYSIKRIGLKGYLFAIIGSWISKRLGKLVGVEPGDEMKAAIRIGRKTGARIALIDQDIEITLARFSKFLTWKERWRIFADIFRGLFRGKAVMREYGLEGMDLSKVPSDEVVVKLISMMRTRYPSIYKVLVDERNHVMAAALATLSHNNPESDIVAVVGAGHIEGIRDLLSRVRVAEKS
jgi:pheromone shutdown-related protein TraB